MKLEQTVELEALPREAAASSHTHPIIWWLERMLITGIVVWAAFILSTSAIPAGEARTRAFALTTTGMAFDLLEWEVDSLRGKLWAWRAQPAAALTDTEAASLVQGYLTRAIRLGHMERELVGLASESPAEAASPADREALAHEIAVLRLEQEQERPAVEQILQHQVSWALRELDLGVGAGILPPVLFAFTEPPRKVIVSPRDRITTIYTRMVEAGLPISTLERIESEIAAEPNAVGYVSNIGGLGAYPSMVVDRATLPWVLSTVAHEWVHNYLTFFPLGLLYFGSGDLTTMNETVADIVGQEVGMLALREFYPDLAPPPEVTETTQAPESDVLPEDSVSEPEPVEEAAFDFRAEMRETRLEVDRLLALGDVDRAEAYMKAQRLYFVENGYPIRVLNQAYFAFHGSYATSPASTSPIGPKMVALRAAKPDLAGFLQKVRWFTSAEDLDAALGLGQKDPEQEQ